MGSRESFAAWSAGLVTCLGLIGVVLFVVALAVGESALLVAGVGLASAGLLISALNVYRLQTRKRP